MSTSKLLWRFRRAGEADRILLNAWPNLRDALLDAWGPVAVRIRYPSPGRAERLWEVDATLLLRQFCLWCAEDVLARSDSGTVDNRSLHAIDTLRRYIAGECTDQELAEAKSEAVEAAEASVRSIAWYADYEMTVDPVARVAVEATLTDPVVAAKRCLDAVERHDAAVRIREATDHAVALQAAHSLPDLTRSAPLLQRLADALEAVK